MRRPPSVEAELVSDTAELEAAAEGAVIAQQQRSRDELARVQSQVQAVMQVARDMQTRLKSQLR